MLKSATEFWLLFNFRCNSMYCTNCKSSFQYTESDWMERGYKTPYFWGNSSLGQVNALHIKTLVSWTDFLKSPYLLTHTFLYQYYLMWFSIALNYTNCFMKHNIKCSRIMLVRFMCLIDSKKSRLIWTDTVMKAIHFQITSTCVVLLLFL